MSSFLKLCQPFYTIQGKKLVEEATLMRQNVEVSLMISLMIPLC